MFSDVYIKVIINVGRHNQFRVDWLNTHGVLVSNCSLQAKVHGQGSSSHFSIVLSYVAMLCCLKYRVCQLSGMEFLVEISRLHASDTIMLPECV